MVNGRVRNWTAQIVIASEHAGLRPHFKSLEAEVMHVLARIDNPRSVVLYLRKLRNASQEYFRWHNGFAPHK